MNPTKCVPNFQTHIYSKHIKTIRSKLRKERKFSLELKWFWQILQISNGSEYFLLYCLYFIRQQLFAAVMAEWVWQFFIFFFMVRDFFFYISANLMPNNAHFRLCLSVPFLGCHHLLFKLFVEFMQDWENIKSWN